MTDLYDWLLPEELALQLPNAASGNLTLACQSYAAGTAVGAPQSVSLTVTVPQSMAPAVSFTWQDTSPAGALGLPVQNVSALALDITADARYGADIVARAASLDGAAYTGGVLTAGGDHTLTVTVTDSRGLTAAASQALTVAAYTPPVLQLSASRCLADGTADDTGSFARVKLTGEVTPIADKNTAALTLFWGSESEQIPVAPGSIAAERILPADPNSTLAIRATLSDALRSDSRSMTLSTGFATVDFLSGGRGIAFGQVATREGFTCAMPVYLEGSRLTGLPAPADSTDAVPKGYADKLRAVNLLDNSDFRNPVNQRGKTGYAGDTYTIDRWSVWAVDGDGTLTVNSGYISFNGGANGGTFTQRFQRGILDSNKTYTMAYQKLSGEIAVFPAAIDYNFYNSCDLLTLCNTQNRTEDMVWAALYEGEYTAETLPEYQPKGYGAELAECQRYYMNFHNLRFNLMYCTDGTYRGAFLLPCSMRITPTVSYGTKGDSDGIVLELVTPNGFSVYAANVTTAYLQLENVLCSADL